MAAEISVLAQSNSVNVELANLRSDLDRLDQQVRSLSVEVEALNRENEQLRETISQQLDSRSEDYVTVSRLNRVLDDFEDKIQSANKSSRKSLIDEVSRELESLAEKTQKAINSLAKAVDSQPQVDEVISFNDNYPQSGTTYTVKSGDSLTRIADKMDSRVAWIRNANRLSSDIIYPGQELFIPQKN